VGGRLGLRSGGPWGGIVATGAAAADTIPALLALDAAARIISPEGEKTVPVSTLLGGVNTTTLKPDEVIVSFQIPVTGKRSAFFKFGPRKAIAISNLSLALAARMEGGVLHESSLAVGAVGVTAYRVPEMGLRLEGLDPKNADAVAAAAAGLGEIVFERLGGKPEFPFKAPYKRNLAFAALKRAVGGLGEEENR